ncbi:MAG: hypothetical protein K2X97_12570 [Mycobacteriaceae bacterium]|nr:hypothetical protein [Mycobacteriaceae bacterium]
MPEPVTAGGITELIFPLLNRAPGNDPAALARQAFEALTCDDKQCIAARATEAVTSLARRFVPERVKSPVRQIISPTGRRFDPRRFGHPASEDNIGGGCCAEFVHQE